MKLYYTIPLGFSMPGERYSKCHYLEWKIMGNFHIWWDREWAVLIPLNNSINKHFMYILFKFISLRFFGNFCIHTSITQQIESELQNRTFWMMSYLLLIVRFRWSYRLWKSSHLYHHFNRYFLFAVVFWMNEANVWMQKSRQLNECEW